MMAEAIGKEAKEAAEIILSMMDSLGILLPSDSNFSMNTFENQLIQFAANSSKDAPSLLCTSSLSNEEWMRLEHYIQTLNLDYAKRIDLLKKRLEITIDSFLWSERVQKMEAQIRQICDSSQFKQTEFQPILADQLLSADSDLLTITKSSSDKFRQKTRVKDVCDFKMRADVIPDRGGRTEQMAPLQRESFQQQVIQRNQQQRGGGDRGGRRGGDFQQQHWNGTNRGGGGGGGNWQSGGSSGVGPGQRGHGGGKRGRYH